MKDCPFCGLQPMTSKNTYNSMRSDDFSVYCGECDIGFTEGTLEEAQRKWDTRVIKCGSVDMGRLKVKEIEYGGWVVPAPVQDALEDLQEKHNELVAFLSTMSQLNKI